MVFLDLESPAKLRRTVLLIALHLRTHGWGVLYGTSHKGSRIFIYYRFGVRSTQSNSNPSRRLDCESWVWRGPCSHRIAERPSTSTLRHGTCYQDLSRFSASGHILCRRFPRKLVSIISVVDNFHHQVTMPRASQWNCRMWVRCPS